MARAEGRFHARRRAARTAYHVVVSAVVALLAVGRALRWLVPSDAADASASPVFARPSGVLFGLGVLAFFGLLAEGAMADWSAVYLRDTLETTPAVAAAGFAAFSLAMAAGRFAATAWSACSGPAGCSAHRGRWPPAGSAARSSWARRPPP